MLNYKFNCGLVRTSELLRATSIPRSTLEYWKFEWRKKGKKTYDMGLRLIGNKAYWEPVQFVNWMSQFILINKPTTPEQKLDQSKAIMFIQKHVAVK